MIRLTKVNPTGYFCYALHDTISIEHLGICLVDGKNEDRGGSNGAGKTSLFYAICDILFGHNPTGESADSITNRALGKRFGILTFTDSDGRTWRIIAPRKWKKSDQYPDMDLMSEPSSLIRLGGSYSGTDVFFERWDGSEWVDERGTNEAGKMRLTVDATRQKICSVINCTYEQFIDTCYLIQQEGLRLLTGKHKDKYEILSRLSRIDKWNNRREAVARRLDSISNEISKLETTLLVAKSNIVDAEKLDEEIAKYNERKSQLVPQLSALSSKDHELRLAKSRLSEELKSKWDMRTNALKTAQSLSSLLEEAIKSKSDAYRQHINNIDSISKSKEPQELVMTRNKISSLTMESSILQHELNTMISNPGMCSRCKSWVTIEQIERQREIIKLKLKELDIEIQSYRDAENTLYVEYREAIDAALRLEEDRYSAIVADIDKRIVEIEAEKVSKTIEAEAILEEWSALNQSEKDLSNQISSVVTNLATMKMELDSISNTLIKLIGDADAARCKQSEINRLELQLQAKQESAKVLQTVERLFGDRGMQAYVLELTVNRLNHHIANKLKTIDQNIKLWFSCFREKADGTTGVDIQVYVKDGDKEQVAFSLYSGGERQILSLVVLDAYSELASHMGTGFNILMLDEVFGPLDSYNSGRLFAYVDSMSSRSKTSILLTAHNQEIKDSIQFDTILTAVRNGGITRIEKCHL